MNCLDSIQNYTASAGEFEMSFCVVFIYDHILSKRLYFGYLDREHKLLGYVLYITLKNLYLK